MHRAFETKISVAINPVSDEAAVDRVTTAGKRLWMVKLANEVTFNRMEKTMGVLKDLGERAPSPLVDVLFGRRKPEGLKPGYEKEELRWFDEGLNDSQKEAVRFALASKEVGEFVPGAFCLFIRYIQPSGYGTLKYLSSKQNTPSSIFISNLQVPSPSYTEFLAISSTIQ